MILSDRDLKTAIKKGRLGFSPAVAPQQIGPCSIDLRLGPDFKMFKSSRLVLIDPKEGLPHDYMEEVRLRDEDKFILHPGDFVLASTIESIRVGDDLMVRVEGKSTLARMGILVHTAGFVDPGFEGNITLEISNQSNVAIALYPGMFICQVAAHGLSSPSEVPYNKRKHSAYKKSKGTVMPNPQNLFKK